MKKRYAKYMVLSILFFSTISIVYQIAVVNNPNFNIYDLGTNLLSEFAGMIFTVLIFNEFIIYRQQLTNTAKLNSLYGELDALIKNLDFPFQEAANKCMADLNGDIWTKEVMNTIQDKIQLNEIADCVFPAVPWYMIFSMQGEKTIQKCQRISAQFQEVLEPDISAHLFYLINHSELLSDLSNIKIIYENDLLLKYPRPKNLGSYFACPSDYDFEVIKQIRDWLWVNQKETEKQTVSIRKTNKIILCVLLVIFTIGAIGYYLHGNYFYTGLFAIITVLFSVILINLNKRNNS